MNECIILPDLGGLETSYLPARVDKESHQLLPPTKSITFRPDYKNGGDSLAQLLVDRLQFSEAEALEEIKAYVQRIKEGVRKNGSYELRGIGSFLVKEGRIDFNSNKEENFLADSFGLDSLDMPTSQTSAVNASQAAEQDKYEVKVVSSKRKNTYALVIAGVIFLLLLIVLTFYLAARFDIELLKVGQSNYNERLVFGNKIAQNEAMNEAIDSEIETQTSTKHALFYSEDSSQAPKANAKDYHLIAGSFRTAQNAKALQKDLNSSGFPSDLILSEGYYRVVLSSHADKRDALNELFKLRKQLGESVWMLSI